MFSATSLRPFLIAFPAIGIPLGFTLQWFGAGHWAGWVWAGFTLPIVLTLLADIVLSLRRGEMGLDIVAALSMSAALIFGEELAGPSWR